MKNLLNQKFLNSSNLSILFFSLILLAGIVDYNDYGISWDEPIQRELGNASLNFVFEHDDSLYHLINKFHGPFIEMVEQVPEFFFDVNDLKEIYLWRHWINFFIFWVGIIFFFLLALRIFKNGWYALSCSAILFLTPRIFAHSFYNSKDIPLLVFFTISIYLLILFIDNTTYKLSILFSLVSAMAFAIRILAILIPALTILAFTVGLLNGNMRFRQLKFLILYLILFIMASYLLYPVIWSHPVLKIQEAFSVMSHYPFNDMQLFMGRQLAPQQLPWYYIPVWMGITIPIAWQILFLIGFVCVIRLLTPDIARLFKTQVPLLIVLAWLFIPYLMILILHSAVYDEWRHLFFIYPAFIIIAVFGIKLIWDKINLVGSRKFKKVLHFLFLAILSFQIINVIDFEVLNHPFENIYFNSLAGASAEKRFDLDYWGLSYRQGVQQLIRIVPENSIKVCLQNAPGNYNLIWLTERERKRILETSWDSADYFVTNYRYHPELFNTQQMKNISSIRVSENTILTVFKK